MDICLMCSKKAESWNLITNNIALKDGDYPGTKNVSRMRNAIVAQRDFLQKGGQPQQSRSTPIQQQPPREFQPPQHHEPIRQSSYHQEPQDDSHLFEQNEQYQQQNQYESIEPEQNIQADDDSLI